MSIYFSLVLVFQPLRLLYRWLNTRTRAIKATRPGHLQYRTRHDIQRGLDEISGPPTGHYTEGIEENYFRYLKTKKLASVKVYTARASLQFFS